MPKLSTIITDGMPSGGDKILITDTNTGNATRTLSIDALAAYLSKTGIADSSKDTFIYTVVSSPSGDPGSAAFTANPETNPATSEITEITLSVKDANGSIRTKLYEYFEGSSIKISVADNVGDTDYAIYGVNNVNIANAEEDQIRLSVIFETGPAGSKFGLGNTLAISSFAHGTDINAQAVQLRHGQGDPDEDVGGNGDFYIDTVGEYIWGPKTLGQWLEADKTNLIGPSPIIGDVTTNTLDPNVEDDASVTVIRRVSDDQTVDFVFNIPRGRPVDNVTYVGGENLGDSTTVTFFVNGTDIGSALIQAGEKGETGDDAGFGIPTVSDVDVVNGVSQPATVTVDASSPETAKIFNFGIPTGNTGADGRSTFHSTIYIRSESAPATPTGGSYDFGTETLTTPTGWSEFSPSGTDQLWTSNAVFSVLGNQDTDSVVTWTSPGRAAVDGLAAGFGTPTVSNVELKLDGEPGDATVDTDANSPDTAKIFDFGIPVGKTGLPAGFGTPTVTDIDVDSVGDSQPATVTVDAASPDTAKIFNFGIPTGSTGNAVLNGTGAPDDFVDADNTGTGKDGDFYINVSNDDLYGPRTSGAWGDATNLVGPPGSGSTITFEEQDTDGNVIETQTGTEKLVFVPSKGVSVDFDTDTDTVSHLTFSGAVEQFAQTVSIALQGASANTMTQGTSEVARIHLDADFVSAGPNTPLVFSHTVGTSPIGFAGSFLAGLQIVYTGGTETLTLDTPYTYTLLGTETISEMFNIAGPLIAAQFSDYTWDSTNNQMSASSELASGDATIVRILRAADANSASNGSTSQGAATVHTQGVVTDKTSFTYDPDTADTVYTSSVPSTNISTSADATTALGEIADAIIALETGITKGAVSDGTFMSGGVSVTSKYIDVDLNTVVNIAQSMSLVIGDGSNGSFESDTFSDGDPTMASTITVTDYASSEVTSFTATSGESVDSIGLQIANAITSNVETPIDFTAEYNDSTNSVELISNSGVPIGDWSVVINHHDAVAADLGDISIDAPINVSIDSPTVDDQFKILGTNPELQLTSNAVAADGNVLSNIITTGKDENNINTVFSEISTEYVSGFGGNAVVIKASGGNNSRNLRTYIDNVGFKLTTDYSLGPLLYINREKETLDNDDWYGLIAFSNGLNLEAPTIGPYIKAHQHENSDYMEFLLNGTQVFRMGNNGSNKSELPFVFDISSDIDAYPTNGNNEGDREAAVIYDNDLEKLVLRNQDNWEVISNPIDVYKQTVEFTLSGATANGISDPISETARIHLNADFVSGHDTDADLVFGYERDGELISSVVNDYYLRQMRVTIDGTTQTVTLDAPLTTQVATGDTYTEVFNAMGPLVAAQEDDYTWDVVNNRLTNTTYKGSATSLSIRINSQADGLGSDFTVASLSDSVTTYTIGTTNNPTSFTFDPDTDDTVYTSAVVSTNLSAEADAETAVDEIADAIVALETGFSKGDVTDGTFLLEKVSLSLYITSTNSSGAAWGIKEVDGSGGDNSSWSATSDFTQLEGKWLQTGETSSDGGVSVIGNVSVGEQIILVFADGQSTYEVTETSTLNYNSNQDVYFTKLGTSSSASGTLPETPLINNFSETLVIHTETPSKYVDIDLNTTSNIGISMTLVTGGGTDTDFEAEEFSDGDPSTMATTVTVSDYDGAEVTSFTCTSRQTIDSIGQQIADAVTSNIETPVDYTGEYDDSTNVILLTSIKGRGIGDWSVVINHHDIVALHLGDAAVTDPTNTTIEAPTIDELRVIEKFGLARSIPAVFDNDQVGGGLNYDLLESTLHLKTEDDGWQPVSSITVEEGTDVETYITQLKFVGDNVELSATGGVATVTIHNTGGGGGGLAIPTITLAATGHTENEFENVDQDITYTATVVQNDAENLVDVVFSADGDEFSDVTDTTSPYTSGEQTFDFGTDKSVTVTATLTYNMPGEDNTTLVATRTLTVDKTKPAEKTYLSAPTGFVWGTDSDEIEQYDSGSFTIASDDATDNGWTISDGAQTINSVTFTGTSLPVSASAASAAFQRTGTITQTDPGTETAIEETGYVLSSDPTYVRIKSVRTGGTSVAAFTANSAATTGTRLDTNFYTGTPGGADFETDLKKGITNPDGEQFSLTRTSGQKFYFMYDNTHADIDLNKSTDGQGSFLQGVWTKGTDVDGFTYYETATGGSSSDYIINIILS